jgi:hypothetical protein
LTLEKMVKKIVGNKESHMSHPPESTLLNGALAGFVATVPMSAAMLTMHRLLPEHEQYPLPPHEITAELAEKADMEEHLD